MGRLVRRFFMKRRSRRGGEVSDAVHEIPFTGMELGV